MAFNINVTFLSLAANAAYTKDLVLEADIVQVVTHPSSSAPGGQLTATLNKQTPNAIPHGYVHLETGLRLGSGAQRGETSSAFGKSHPLFAKGFCV